jgi:hypothetical protein
LSSILKRADFPDSTAVGRGIQVWRIHCQSVIPVTDSEKLRFTVAMGAVQCVNLKPAIPKGRVLP